MNIAIALLSMSLVMIVGGLTIWIWLLTDPHRENWEDGDVPS